MEKAKYFSEDDYVAFNRLLHMANEAVLEMKSTSDIRRSKKILREYFISIELENYDAILSKLACLEITTEETIYNNLDLLKRKNILDLLDAICEIAPLITGTQTILFATNKVSKLVFATKSYSHTSLSNDPTVFDLIKNI